VSEIGGCIVLAIIQFAEPGKALLFWKVDHSWWAFYPNLIQSPDVPAENSDMLII